MIEVKSEGPRERSASRNNSRQNENPRLPPNARNDLRGQSRPSAALLLCVQMGMEEVWRRKCAVVVWSCWFRRRRLWPLFKLLVLKRWIVWSFYFEGAVKADDFAEGLSLSFPQTGTVRSTNGSGTTTTMRCPAWRARGRRSGVGSEVVDEAEEEAGAEEEEEAEVIIFFPDDQTQIRPGFQQTWCGAVFSSPTYVTNTKKYVCTYLQLCPAHWLTGSWLCLTCKFNQSEGSSTRWARFCLFKCFQYFKLQLVQNELLFCSAITPPSKRGKEETLLICRDSKGSHSFNYYNSSTVNTLHLFYFETFFRTIK